MCQVQKLKERLGFIRVCHTFGLLHVDGIIIPEIYLIEMQILIDLLKQSFLLKDLGFLNCKG